MKLYSKVCLIILTSDNSYSISLIKGIYNLLLRYFVFAGIQSIYSDNIVKYI